MRKDRLELDDAGVSEVFFLDWLVLPTVTLCAHVLQALFDVLDVLGHRCSVGFVVCVVARLVGDRHSILVVGIVGIVGVPRGSGALSGGQS